MNKLLVVFASAVLSLCSTNVNAGTLKIEYQYGSKFGFFDIADSARAYLNGDLVAKAEAIEIIKKTPGPNSIKIRETQYSPSGAEVYEGYIEIQFGFGGGRKISEDSISGSKRYNIFTSWPAGGL
jgi:hypothetical protein